MAHPAGRLLQQQPSIELAPVRHIELGNMPDDMGHAGTAGAAELEAAAHPPPPPHFRFPWGRAACAGFMLVASIVIGISAAVVGSLAAGIISALLFLPGAYVTWAYVQVYRGNPDYIRERWLGIEFEHDAEPDHV